MFCWPIVCGETCRGDSHLCGKLRWEIVFGDKCHGDNSLVTTIWLRWQFRWQTSLVYDVCIYASYSNTTTLPIMIKKRLGNTNSYVVFEAARAKFALLTSCHVDLRRMQFFTSKVSAPSPMPSMFKAVTSVHILFKKALENRVFLLRWFVVACLSVVTGLQLLRTGFCCRQRWSKWKTIEKFITCSPKLCAPRSYEHVLCKHYKNHLNLPLPRTNGKKVVVQFPFVF